MRTMTMLALAATVTATAVPAAAYYLTRPGDDPLGDTLRQYGFVPINPPSNLMNVGSLYYVDSAVKDFKAICHAEKADLNGGVVKDYVVKVHSSLTDVVLEEIPLGPNWTIFAKLMEKPQCSHVAMQYIHAGGYVCQGQKILQATAEFKLDRDAQSKLATRTRATADNIKDIVKLAVESQSDQSVVDKEGRLFAGTALKYGVSMNPICLAPPNGRFQRVLPRTALGRVTNFVLYNVVEPILPARPDRLELAQARHDAEAPK